MPHTPGEWKAWKSPEGWTVRAVYRDEQDRRVTAWPALCKAGAQDNEANAKLMAAAPDFLAACRAMGRALEGMQLGKAEIEAMMLVDAAISKATT